MNKNGHMTKKFISVLLAILMLLLCGCGAEPCDYHDIPMEYVKELDYHDGFTVLQLTDIHWSSGTQIGDETCGQEGYLRKVIEEAASHAGPIDLIEITGDTFMLSGAKEVRAFIDIMTDIGIPYAINWGNHDMEGKYSPNWISRQFLEAPCSLYTEVDNDNVHNRSNYVINLMDEDKVVWQIFNLDSGAGYREGAADIGLTYDYIRQDQLDWLLYEHSLTENVPALCYYHIPQADFDLAYERCKSGDEFKNGFYKLEGFAPSKYAPVTEDVCAQNNVKGVFVGHAHGNDWTFTSEKGIIFGLGVKTGTELYYFKEPEKSPADDTADIIGGSLVTILDRNGSFKLEHLYLNEGEGADTAVWVEY